MAGINTSRFVPVRELRAGEINENSDLMSYADDARRFLARQPWCDGIGDEAMACGWPGILAVFYVQVVESPGCPDPAVWIVTGDIPPAYIDIISCRTPREVLGAYCRTMQGWIDRVLEGEPVNDAIPVCYRGTLKQIPATAENAERLRSRIEYISAELIPRLPT